MEWDASTEHESGREPIRVAAVGDLHCRESSAGRFRRLFANVHAEAEVLCLCGDLTEHGRVFEAEVLAEDLRNLGVPVVAVLGNHDHESGEAGQVARVLAQAGVQVLDGTTWETGSVGFAGVKGFAGGYGAAALQAWGEGPLKQFVHAAVEEARKLERALAALQTEHRVVLMHYAPVRDTLQGEHAEIFPFLGCSRLMEPVETLGASVVLHGHAHHGAPRGAGHGGVPVFNVALPLLWRSEGRPYRVIAL